jgi:TRAP-type uncharacterized transport system fused permease subunit
MFIYNTKLLMMNTNVLELIYIIPISILGMFCWSVFIQGHWRIRTYVWERFVFLGLAFLLVNPGHLSIGDVHLNQHLVNGLAIVTMVVIYMWQRARQKKAAAIAA